MEIGPYIAWLVILLIALKLVFFVRYKIHEVGWRIDYLLLRQKGYGSVSAALRVWMRWPRRPKEPINLDEPITWKSIVIEDPKE
ncbi:MAG: hypothetical protein V2A79_09820 [Planctomycetota bacterium]